MTGRIDAQISGLFAEHLRAHPEEAARIATHKARYDAAQAPMIAELAAAGVAVRDVQDLGVAGVGDSRALPVLLEWLPRVEYPPLRLSIVHALRRPWAKRPEVARELLAAYHRAGLTASGGSDNQRSDIGLSLERIATEAVVEDLIDIATDETQRYFRGSIVLALGNMRKERDRVIPVLVDLLPDRDMTAAAIQALGRLRAVQVRDVIAPYLDDRDTLVRNRAKVAIRKIDESWAP